jgi:hypothetical protein
MSRGSKLRYSKRGLDVARNRESIANFPFITRKNSWNKNLKTKTYLRMNSSKRKLKYDNRRKHTNIRQNHTGSWPLTWSKQCCVGVVGHSCTRRSRNSKQCNFRPNNDLGVSILKGRKKHGRVRSASGYYKTCRSFMFGNTGMKRRKGQRNNRRRGIWRMNM